jgi:4-amino-4-deoxy-L-arabinose transferase-like glycosyltransferase
LKSINYALLFIGCIVFHAIGTWSLPLIDRDEPRFAEASREMIERGDCVIPYFNNQFRFDKPPLTYWAQVASYKIFGQNDFGARFPSAVAAGLVALTLVAWGNKVGGNQVGLGAAIIFTLSLQTFVHAKAAVADMWLVLFVTMAHWAGYELIQRPTLNAQHPMSNTEGVEAGVLSRRSQWSWWLLFYVSLALGFLAKGPIAWTPLLTIALWRFLQNDVQIAYRFKFVRGILLMLAIVALWGIPALIRTHGDFFRIGIGRHVIGRSVGAMEGHGANSLGVYLLLLPFYFITIFVSFFPWSIKLPWLVKKLWRERDRRRRRASDFGSQADSYLIAGTAIIFLIFSVIKTKLPHYTLPAFPLLSLLLARKLLSADNSASPQLGGLNPSSFKRVAIGIAVVLATIAVVVPPFVARSFPAYDLFQQSRDYLRPEMEFGAVDYQEPSLVWYFRSRVHGFMTPLTKKNAAEFMARTGPRFVILPERLLPQLFPNASPDWKVFSTNGFNLVKGKKVEITLVVKPE